MEVSLIDLVNLEDVDEAAPAPAPTHDERNVHYQCGLDTAFLHFAGAVIEYRPPDRVLPYSKTRGLGPIPRRESVRLVSARLLDLERKKAHVLYDTEGGVRMTVLPHPPKQTNAFEIASMAQSCGKLLAEWSALFAESEPPIAIAIENPKPQKNDGGGWRGPPNQYSVAVAPFAVIGALDAAKGLPPRFVEFRQAKADVKRGSEYAVHKEEAIERTRQIMKRNGDAGGLKLLEEMTAKHFKIDDIADAYLLAVKAARTTLKVTTKQLARVAERLRQADAGEDAAPAIKKKRKRVDADGPPAKRAKKE
jgi:hypothetical protein